MKTKRRKTSVSVVASRKSYRVRKQMQAARKRVDVATVLPNPFLNVKWGLRSMVKDVLSAMLLMPIIGLCIVMLVGAANANSVSDRYIASGKPCLTQTAARKQWP